ncbi:hypothetical protein CRG98_016243 [Punica granatum]|uniref:Uncharacterized protein n=1 Tax=Punica granatum TaxID=22663 RepID=A0A2I0K480_PUNGR|nr:hypothetical protein CRG98_016243 [Punica granatum]
MSTTSCNVNNFPGPYGLMKQSHRRRHLLAFSSQIYMLIFLLRLCYMGVLRSFYCTSRGVIRTAQQKSHARGRTPNDTVKLYMDDVSTLAGTGLIFRAQLTVMEVEHNDVYDFDTGADKNKKESVVNLAGSMVDAHPRLHRPDMGLTGSRKHPFGFVTGCCNSVRLYIPGPTVSIKLPWLGRALVLASGPFAYFSQGSTSGPSYLPLDGTILCSSLFVGFTSSLILFCSHFHQFLCALTLPMGNRVITYVEENHEVSREINETFMAIDVTKRLIALGRTFIEEISWIHCLDFHWFEQDKRLIFMAKYYCVKLHALFGVALAVGLVVARKMA